MYHGQVRVLSGDHEAVIILGLFDAAPWSLVPVLKPIMQNVAIGHADTGLTFYRDMEEFASRVFGELYLQDFDGLKIRKATDHSRDLSDTFWYEIYPGSPVGGGGGFRPWLRTHCVRGNAGTTKLLHDGAAVRHRCVETMREEFTDSLGFSPEHLDRYESIPIEATGLARRIEREHDLAPFVERRSLSEEMDQHILHGRVITLEEGDAVQS